MSLHCTYPRPLETTAAFPSLTMANIPPCGRSVHASDFSEWPVAHRHSWIKRMKKSIPASCDYFEDLRDISRHHRLIIRGDHQHTASPRKQCPLFVHIIVQYSVYVPTFVVRVVLQYRVPTPMQSSALGCPRFARSAAGTIQGILAARQTARCTL